MVNREFYISAYWAERKRFLAHLKQSSELRQRYWKASAMYLLRRLLWSFGFFPIFIAFWVPLIMSGFNPVILLNDAMPVFQAFLDSTPQMQQHRLETLALAWFSIGVFFLIFDFVLTPFRSPFQYEADVHMRAWEQLQLAERVPDEEEPALAGGTDEISEARDSQSSEADNRSQLSDSPQGVDESDSGTTEPTPPKNVT